MSRVFFFNDTATTEIYTLSLHDALPISARSIRAVQPPLIAFDASSQDTVLFREYDSFAMWQASAALWPRSEEDTSELQSSCNLVCRLLLEKRHDFRALRPHFLYLAQ